MKTSTAINEIFTSLAKFQSEMKGADKGGTNPHFKSKYSTFEDAWNAIRPYLGSNGLSILQEVVTKETSVAVITLVAHSGGQWIEFGPLEIPFAKRDAHAIGSACSYAKRYALCAAIGIVAGTEEDDDGNAAVVPQSVPIKQKFLSDAQCHEIDTLLNEDMELLNRILSGYRVDKLKEIPEMHFNVIIKNLKSRKSV